MTNWNGEYFGMLVGAFWVGFSLFFYGTFMVLVALRTGRKSWADPPAGLPFYLRLVISIPSFVGVAGTIYLLGAVSQVDHWDIAFVVGLPAGVFVALFIDKHIRVRL